MPAKREIADHYGAHYREFAGELYADVRREAFGDDIGQNSWLTIQELERFDPWLRLEPSTRLLDVACGSGGPALHLSKLTGCQVVGIELDQDAVTNGNQAAHERGLDGRARFAQADANVPLPFEDSEFDAVLCVDAINHFRDRARVFADWARVLRPGGRVVFTDPVVITGALGSDELETRTSIGYFLFVPFGENERLLAAAGFSTVAVEDTTASLADIARRRGEARLTHAAALRRVEGDEAFDGRQSFFATVALLAREGRLSRFAYVAERR